MINAIFEGNATLYRGLSEVLPGAKIQLKFFFFFKDEFAVDEWVLVIYEC